MNRRESRSHRPAPRQPESESSGSFKKFRLGGFLVEKILGKGAMGIVFRARDLTLNRPVALKVLTSALNREPDARQRFLEEARAAASLNHKNIIRVHHVGADPQTGRAFLSMELIEGITLAKRLQRDDLSFREIIRIVRDLASGLEHAWDNGLVHRDVKPGNVMLTSEGEVKLLDFGLAQKPEQGMRVAGTPAYMSPEQAEGRRVDVRSDLYALGVILYEMLAGTQPFAARALHQMQYLHAFAQPRRISAVRKNLPVGFERILIKLLAKNRDDRFSRPIALIEALDALAGQLSRQRLLDTAPLGPVVKPVMQVEIDVEEESYLNTKQLDTAGGLPRRRAWLLPAVAVGLLLAAAAALVGWLSPPFDPGVSRAELIWSAPQPIWTNADATEQGWQLQPLHAHAQGLVCRGDGVLIRALGSDRLHISGALIDLGATSGGLSLEVANETVWALRLRKLGRQTVVAVDLKVPGPDGDLPALAAVRPLTGDSAAVSFDCWLLGPRVRLELGEELLVWDLPSPPDRVLLSCEAPDTSGLGVGDLVWSRGFPKD